MVRFGRKKKKAHGIPNQEMSLNITSMADIFTIILVFLLKTFATGAMNVTPSNGLLLPQATANDAALEAIKLEVGKTAILVEGNTVAQLRDFVPDSKDLGENGSIKPLLAALNKERQRQIAIAKVNSDVKVDAKIVVIADQAAPYKTIKNALATSALAGFTDYKLAVVKLE